MATFSELLQLSHKLREANICNELSSKQVDKLAKLCIEHVRSQLHPNGTNHRGQPYNLGAFVRNISAENVWRSCGKNITQICKKLDSHDVQMVVAQFCVVARYHAAEHSAVEKLDRYNSIGELKQERNSLYAFPFGFGRLIPAQDVYDVPESN